jgi:hypothetical protein
MKIGLICSLKWERSIVIEIYYRALKNIYGDIKLINTPSDAHGLDVIFIGNDHFQFHVDVWNTDAFIDICNKENIKVVFIGAEKIKNTVYPMADILLDRANQIKNLTHYMWDVEDVKLLNKKILGYAASKYYENCVDTSNKINKCIFIGQTLEPHYKDRRDALSKIGQYIDIDIISSKDYYSPNVKEHWKDYLQKIAQYRFVFCPRSGTSNAIPFRFYEGLLTDTIPILQVQSDTMKYHPEEAALKDVIFFEKIEELSDKLKNFTHERCTSKIWFEDKLIKTFKEDNIYLP